MQLCVDVPSPEIVFTGSWLSQTTAQGSSSSPVPIYTFASTGQFRISVSLETVVSSGTPAVFLSFWSSYTGGADQVEVLPNSSSGMAFVLTVSSGQECNFYTRISGSGSLDHYDLYVAIEQLQ
jgi:hypothetical protein